MSNMFWSPNSCHLISRFWTQYFVVVHSWNPGEYWKTLVYQWRCEIQVNARKGFNKTHAGNFLHPHYQNNSNEIWVAESGNPGIWQMVWDGILWPQYFLVNEYSSRIQYIYIYILYIYIYIYIYILWMSLCD